MTGTRKRSLTKTFAEPTNLKPQEYLLNVREVAKMFGVTVSTVNQWVKKEWIKSYKIPASKNQVQGLEPSQRNSRVYFTNRDCIEWGIIWYDIPHGKFNVTDKELQDAVDDLG